MTPDEFAEWAGRTAGVSETTVDREKLAYLALGIAGEAGEVAEMMKKLIRDGRFDRGHLAEELSDVIYYWASLCRVAGVAPTALMEASRRKIEGKIAQVQAQQ